MYLPGYDEAFHRHAVQKAARKGFSKRRDESYGFLYVESLGDARPEPAELFFQQPNAKKKTPRLSGVECLVYSKSRMAYKLRINMALA